MRVLKVQHGFARGMFAALVAAMVLFAGLGPAGAGFIILHQDNQPTWVIPGETIEAETWTRAVGITNRPTSDAGGGEAMRWIQDGDWAEYKILAGDPVIGPHPYLLEARVASATNGGTIHVVVDGEHVGSVDVPNTGGAERWTTVSTVVTIPNGAKVLRLDFSGDDERRSLFRLNWLHFEYDGPVPEPPVDPRPPHQLDTIPGLIEAEYYSDENGVQIQYTSDVGGGANIGWIEDGDWTEYDVDVQVPGAYVVNARVASKKEGGTINIDINGVRVGSVDVGHTGGWQEWTTVSTPIDLETATLASELRLTYNGDSGESLLNLNWISFDHVLELPGLVQAEMFDDSSDLPTYGNTSDVGGGGYLVLSDGDWSEYVVEGYEHGEYVVDARVATVRDGGTIDITFDGSPVGSIEVTATGGINDWATVRGVINLPPGRTLPAPLRLSYSGEGDGQLFNLNWFEFVPASEAPGPEAPGPEAPGPEAPGPEAPGPEAPAP